MAKYTVDDECCRNIDAYIKQTQSTVDTLVQIHSSHDFSDGKSFNKVLKEYGLGVEAVAGGGMSSSAAKKAECYKEVIREIESSTTINVTMAIQLALIGGHGYYNPVSWLIHDKGYAHAQWMLTRLVIEITRVSLEARQAEADQGPVQEAPRRRRGEQGGRQGQVRREGRIGAFGSMGEMAVRQGFEPWRRFPAYTRSRRAPSTTRPPHRYPPGPDGCCRARGRVRPRWRQYSRNAWRFNSPFVSFFMLSNKRSAGLAQRRIAMSPGVSY
jgi:hypothetical protein